MAEALHIDRDRLLLSPPEGAVPKRFSKMVERRAKGEPVAYITGRRAFWNVDLHVGPGVLVPRPDSEVLVASAIEHFQGTPGPGRILDLGTGPGTLLLASLDVWPSATGLGIDVSRSALSYASANARRLRFERRLKLKLGNWADSVTESFDLVLREPPPSGAVNLGYNEITWHLSPGTLHQGPGPGPLQIICRALPFQPPTQSAVLQALRCADRNERVRGGAYAPLCPAETKGQPTLRKDGGFDQ